LARLKRVKGTGDPSRLLSFRSLLSRRKRSINNQTSIVIFPRERLLKYLTKLFYLKFKKKEKRKKKHERENSTFKFRPFYLPSRLKKVRR
jgi:hypothetical protein